MDFLKKKKFIIGERNKYMKTYRKIFALFSIAIIYMLVNAHTEFVLWERIAWLIGVLCYCIAFNTMGDDD